MTEQEWLECTEPTPMLEFLRGKASERKLRLFAVACCRRIWDLLTDERSRNSVEVEERCLDGERIGTVEAEVRRQAHRAAAEKHLAITKTTGLANRTLRRMEAAAASAASAPWERGGVFMVPPAETRARGVAYRVALAVKHSAKNKGMAGRPSAKTERFLQTALLRDVVGDPSRQILIEPRWLTSSVIDLAKAIYDDRAFDRMPILADALMDAGCDNEDILAHCRSEGPHVRGCWVVDLILGKE